MRKLSKLTLHGAGKVPQDMFASENILISTMAVLLAFGLKHALRPSLRILSLQTDPTPQVSKNFSRHTPNMPKPSIGCMGNLESFW